MKLLLLPQNLNKSPAKSISRTRWLACGPFRLSLGKRTLVMGILNVTPDSFSDGGRYASPRRALLRALAMQEEGADLIDIGGESTRPGAKAVSAQEQMRRILPVIERLAPQLRIPISVDTSKAVVAKQAIQEGASLVNDVSALGDPKMSQVIAASGVPVILMHMRGTPRTMQARAHYRQPIPEILRELQFSIEKAHRAGISDDQILIDPGIGFSKGLRENLIVFKELAAFKKWGFPIVIGPSRKSFIGEILGKKDPGERLFGTAAAVAWAAMHQADIVRVHDVAPMREVVEMTQAILEAPS